MVLNNDNIDPLDDIDALEDAYESCSSVDEIAARLGAEAAAVRSALEEIGLRPPDASPKWAMLLTESYLTEALERDGTWAAVAARVGCAENTVRRYARKAGLIVERTHPPEFDDEWQLRSVLASFGTDRAAAAHLGVSPARLYLAMVRLGIATPHAARVLAEDPSLAELVRSGHGVADLADSFGVTTRTVRAALLHAGLPNPDETTSEPDGFLHDRARLEDLYLTQGLTQTQIAEIGGVAQAQVSRALIRLGIPTRKSKYVQYPELDDVAFLRACLEQGLTYDQIADRVGCSWGGVMSAMTRHGLSVGRWKQDS